MVGISYWCFSAVVGEKLREKVPSEGIREKLHEKVPSEGIPGFTGFPGGDSQKAPRAGIPHACIHRCPFEVDANLNWVPGTSLGTSLGQHGLPSRFASASVMK